MSGQQFIIEAFTLVAASCFVMLSYFFYRNRQDPLINALFVFFSVTAFLYVTLFVIGEILLGIGPTHEWGRLRIMTFRVGQCFALMWLVYRLWRR